MMRAAVLHGPDDLRIIDLPRPDPGPGEVLVRVKAALTCGTDVKMRQRGSHPALGPLPARFGHELAGEVAAVGEGVERFRPGQQVVVANSAPCDRCFFCRRGQLSQCEDLLFMFGAFAEYVVVPARIVARNLYELPLGLDHRLAPLIEPLACVVHGVEKSGLNAGDQVVVVGGGAIGLMMARVATLAGGRVLLVDRHEDRRALARQFGAVDTVDPTAEADVVEAVRQRTEGGHGADIAVEAVGRIESWEQSVAIARRGGTAVLFGGTAAGARLSVDAQRLHYGELTLRGVFHHHPGAVAKALDLLATNQVDASALISGSFPLEKVGDALDLMVARKGIKYRIEP